MAIRVASLLFFNTALAITALPACVTVNVNFPEAAVQQATDDYVQELYKAKEKDRAQPSTGAPIPTPSKKPSANWIFPDIISSQAFAAELPPSAGMKIRVDSPKARSIRDRQVLRLDKIREAEKAGQIGETNQGLLTLEVGDKKTAAIASGLQPLVEAENKDRKDLYSEILSSNGYPPSRMIDLEKSFARSFQSHAAPGTWIQDDAGKWLKKP